jgi:hypothetical protein
LCGEVVSTSRGRAYAKLLLSLLHRAANYLDDMEKPLVMKSLSLPFPFCESDLKRLLYVSFVPRTLRRLLRSFSSSRTRAVNIAVAGFFIPAGTAGVEVLL